jgi:hypothetical protein
MTMNESSNAFAQRLLGAVDLAIDFATLGEYGLEPSPADGPVRERRGRRTAWEALTAARRGGCPRTTAGRRERPRTRPLAC